MLAKDWNEVCNPPRECKKRRDDTPPEVQNGSQDPLKVTIAPTVRPPPKLKVTIKTGTLAAMCLHNTYIHLHTPKR